jgi:hypothetical protein
VNSREARGPCLAVMRQQVYDRSIDVEARVGRVEEKMNDAFGSMKLVVNCEAPLVVARCALRTRARVRVYRALCSEKVPASPAAAGRGTPVPAPVPRPGTCQPTRTSKRPPCRQAQEPPRSGRRVRWRCDAEGRLARPPRRRLAHPPRRRSNATLCWCRPATIARYAHLDDDPLRAAAACSSAWGPFTGSLSVVLRPSILSRRRTMRRGT